MGAVVRPWAHEAVNLQASGDGTLIRGRPEDYEGQPLFSSYWKWKEDLIWSSGCAQRSGAAQKRLSDWSISPSQLQEFFSSHGPAKWVCSAVDSVEQGEVRLEERDAQCELVEPLRQLVEQRGGDVESADDRELLRFLRSRSMDMDKAAAAFVSHQKWRSEYVPKGRFTEADLPTELDAKKSYWIEQDKKGRPVLLTLGRNHVYNKQDPGEFTRFLVYALDKAIAGAPPNTHNFLTVVDLKGIGVKNLDSKSLLVAFEVLQNHYPDRIDKIFMVNAPLIFNGLWKVVSKLIDEGTKKKIIFLNNKNLTETLLKEIDAEFLPKDYGGNADLLLLQDAIVSKGPDAPLETADQSSYL
ncbi:hypothetical protein AXG93_3960s1370 [Marchantia polymorpha subsp. ruderalis]|uniref:CRAL-TRIO domain-containing protein n=1 Tax=Marchantia polymorpha subsp. ruderalis TaxID=1480154 RepID=A0A176VKE8_MARPO|nr:hypothetical protein AXG93_3960s1370 [Marchantia polymorpha subsp. ruderalis]